jgi:hypothetical protein
LNHSAAVRLNEPLTDLRFGRDVPESGRIMLNLSFVETDPNRTFEPIGSSGWVGVNVEDRH